jgi:hypothetical protein
MEDSIQEYVPIIEEEFKRLGLFYNPHASGLALHRVQFHRDTKTFTYQCTEANEIFPAGVGIEGGLLGRLIKDAAR